MTARRTKQRTAVADLLDGLDEFKSAQQLHELLRVRGESVGLTTVYRSLQAMDAAGEVDMLVNDEGEAVYRKCASVQHHHHLVCRGCGATVEIAGPAVESWADAVAEQHGYADISHTLEIFGTCTKCR